MRLVAASRSDLASLVAAGGFRADLFYRLSVVRVRIPPLRERPGDVPLLAQHFLAMLNRGSDVTKRFSPSFLEALGSRRWAGNVRELKNSVERSFILADEVLDVDLSVTMPTHTPEPVEAARPAGVHVPLGSRLDEAERSLIEVTLDYCEGDKRRAAAVLGCSLKTLYNKLNSYARERAENEQNIGRHLPNFYRQRAARRLIVSS